VIHAEPHDTRMLVVDRGAVVVEGRRLLGNADDAAYSPDGTLVAFARDGDLWLANADGSGRRRLAGTPNVAEWGPSWLPSGDAFVYTAEVNGARQIRVFKLPAGPSRKLADGSGAVVSSTGKVAYVVDGTTVTVAGRPFDTPATTFTGVTDLAWSPDGRFLTYSADGTIVVDNGTAQLIGPPGTSPVWSPAGSRIAFSDAGELKSMAADATDVRDLGATGAPVDWRVVPTGIPKFPDLVQRPPSGLVIERARNGHWLLGFTTMVDNRGPGALWIKARRSGHERVMHVRQLVQLRGGGVRVDSPSGELHYVVAPPHYHWHFLGFVHAELRTAGDFVLRVRDHKSGFCLADHYGTAPGIPHDPARFLGNCEQFQPDARAVREGESVGYTDKYPAFFHGQQLDITGLKSGKYWLVHRANEDFHLRESSYDDNVASVLVRLAWRGGVPTVTPLRTCRKERC
jgi:Lysyl oxidase/WD40-like Beta Propeller Repeat